MRLTVLTRALFLLVALPTGAPLAAQSTPAEDVRRAEAAFAGTMAARDFAAFATYIAEEAIFFGRSGPLRGKAAVLEGWRPFFAGATAPFSWHPEVVEVLESGTLALSSGPVRDPTGRLVGTFNSVWRKGPDGRWLVVFDKGCPAAEPR